MYAHLSISSEFDRFNIEIIQHFYLDIKFMNNPTHFHTKMFNVATYAREAFEAGTLQDLWRPRHCAGILQK